MTDSPASWEVLVDSWIRQEFRSGHPADSLHDRWQPAQLLRCRASKAKPNGSSDNIFPVNESTNQRFNEQPVSQSGSVSLRYTMERRVAAAGGAQGCSSSAMPRRR